MRTFHIFTFLFCSLFEAQVLRKVQITDFETNNPISSARLISKGDVFYSNEEGYFIIPENLKSFELTAFGYKTENFTNHDSVLKLKALYKDIEEVKIVNVDIRKIFKDVSNNYKKRYYSDPSIYDITYKQKNEDDGAVSFLLIADGKLWTDSNMYNFKYALHREYDKFIQMEILKTKYFKSSISGDEVCKGQSLNESRDFVGNIFLNYELNRVNYYFKGKDAKYSGKIVNESGSEQTIVFKINSSEIDVSGNIIYNTADKTITHYELEYDQTKYPSYKRKTKDNIEYDFKVGNGVVYFDFYKINDKYVPSISGTKGFSYCTIDGATQKNSFSRDIIFTNFSPTDSIKIPNKLDLTIPLWKNINTQTQNDNSVILSKEEQKFIYDKTYEK